VAIGIEDEASTIEDFRQAGVFVPLEIDPAAHAIEDFIEVPKNTLSQGQGAIMPSVSRHWRMRLRCKAADFFHLSTF
jgi:hypothetical protein